MTDVGIAVVAVGLPDEEARFLSALSASKPRSSFRVAVERHFDGPLERLNKSLLLNRAIAALADCRVIVQTDIDYVIPPRLVDVTVEKTGDRHYWARGVYGPVPSILGRDALAHLRLHRPHWFRCPGSWNAMTPANWRLVGGFDERCWGWGGEDMVLHRSIASAGIETLSEWWSDLVHVAHPLRPWYRAGRAWANGHQHPHDSG